MDDCDNILLVQAEFDGELDAADAVAAIRHREDCATCRSAYAMLATTRTLMHDAPRFAAPGHLHRALRRGLDTPASAPTRAAAWWRDGASFALGAGLAAAIALLVVMPSQPALIDQIVGGHVRALQPGHLEDVASTDQHTVKPWFDGKIDFAPPVKDLAAQDFPLIGGRLDYVAGHPAAALVYRRDKHVIDLFIWPKSGTVAPSAFSRSGYSAIHWTEDGMTKWAVSDLEAGELRDFVARWRAAR